MLKAIKRISGVGLFCDATGASQTDLSEVTLIYGENARGKSTLASIFGAAATSDPAPIKERKTIDQDLAPEVEFLLTNGKTVRYKDGSWKGDVTNLRVFDAEFVDRNVHSGSIIDVAHRRNLLTLAVGEESVKAKRAQEALATRRTDAMARKASNETRIGKISGSMDVQMFIGLPKVDDADNEIAAKQKQIVSILAQHSIANQEKPRLHALPEFDIELLLETLERSLENLHDEAEAAVREHIDGRDSPGLEAWIAKGVQFAVSESCPFCGQETREIDLIAHYRSVFDDKYSELKADLEGSLRSLEKAVPADLIQEFEKNLAQVNGAIELWVSGGHIVAASGSSDGSELERVASAFRDAVSGAIAGKQVDLNYVPSEDEKKELRSSFNAYISVFRGENTIVQSALDAISQYLATLGTLDAKAAQDELARLKSAKARHSNEGDLLATERQTILAELKKIEREAKSARERERTEMGKSFDKYAKRINHHLNAQNARFTIEDAGMVYAGGPPGTTYTIKMRGQVVKLKGDANTFKTALSESDKRSMAFAFFLASTLDDPNLSDRTVVVDDPMSSLDRRRRSKTLRYLADIALKCEQLIVLAHDPRFLLDLDSEIRRLKKHHPSDGGMHKIARTHLKLASVKTDPNLDPYTDFIDCDLPIECESKYARNYRTVLDFVADPTNDYKNAAEAIRPLLEGYLHRRFPGLLKQNGMLGDSLSMIEKSSVPSPLVIAKDQLDEMYDVGYFGNNPHHDADTDYQPPLPSHDEAYGYAEKCLKIVHGQR